MRTPGDVDGPQLVKALRVFGYLVDRQKGSHIEMGMGSTASRASGVQS